MWLLLSIAIFGFAKFTAGATVQCSAEFIENYGALFPVAGSCDTFLACTRGVLTTVTCPRGGIFDIATNRCSTDADAKCYEEEWPSTDYSCGTLDEAYALANPYNCAKYALCLGESILTRQCDLGRFFNSQTGLCDIAQNVFCDLNCPIEGNEVVYLADSTKQNCAKYYVCVNGNPQSGECSSMQYFDLVTESCTAPAEASCRVQDVECSLQDELVANPMDCTSYYECENGFPHYMKCGDGQHFSNGQCIFGECSDLLTDEPEDTTVTTAGTATTEVSTTDVITTEITITDVITDVRTDVTTDVITDVSTDVSTDVTTDVTTDVITDVSTDVTTDVTTDVITDVTTDVVTTGIPTTEIPTTEVNTTEIGTTGVTDVPSTDPAVVCQNVSIGIIAHPFNCYQYFVCIFDAGKLFTCPNDHIFDAVSVCVRGNVETCIPTRLLM